ncbi:hypothetical protein ACR79M_18265 [Sphingobacterium spiritivorum]|uniref:hypothetical protein n=1 Tax=Sphingobacterium TaxID=28453 RepID=UPI0025E33C64|nr:MULTISPECIES: hypothetical protein [unclassified Sphingobacterium]
MERINIIYDVYQRAIGKYTVSIRSFYSAETKLGIGLFVNEVDTPLFYYKTDKSNSIPYLGFNHSQIKVFMDSDNYENKNVESRFINFTSLIKMFEFYAYAHFDAKPQEFITENQVYIAYITAFEKKMSLLK